ncbi:putative disease resistance protein RGA3 isoform X1 [Medicago truncatula]|uniref:Disease resistance protein (CC-NBS-LRR class) family protein n=1 Tax=Medicago truncatula TaxID=3880 RepID=G7ZUZ7_MEDTR|nr:putative disease resistance protein RGA3 isoform X1 [Medicago truncatula]XP_039682688.1 putative disease resistance protein RGA3 isoform X1 [Medicago truncatula]KEH25214.1 disease resistance protein (CC-NBS-LRR class) family protein [Medicago truncatula]
MADQLELISYSVFESVIYNLTMLASSDYGRDHGFSDKLNTLCDRIKILKENLVDADKMQELDRTKHIYIEGQIFVIDDFWDLIVTEILRLDRFKACNLFSCMDRFHTQSAIARNIYRLGNIIDKTGMDRILSFQPMEFDSARNILGNSFNESDIIGREDEKREIIRLLMLPADGKENISIIAIVGMGGIGKTTVAQMIYNDRQVKGFFDICIWVNVSYDSDIKNIADQILDSSSGSTNNDQDSLETWQNELRKKLNGKKYLLVMDDIWNESKEKWTELKTYLTSGAPGTKIVVTTRSEKVAEVMEVYTSVHLTSLSEEDSWCLLKKLVFRNDDDPRTHLLEPVGKKIGKKCRGVPLAIRSAARVLHSTDTESEWILASKFKIDINIMSSPETSYKDLSPPQLKQCLAYCCIYPMGCEIEKNELIQLWMAQDYLGYINSELEMEDVGNGFVNTLLRMSFIQDPKMDEYGNVVSFKMHEFKCNYDDFFDDGTVNRPTHMCLSLESHAFDLLRRRYPKRMRTFLLQRKSDRENVWMTRDHLSVVVRLKYLRALNLSHSSLRMFPDLIGQLVRLRYLDLSWCIKLARLPKSIGRLVNLQTLKLTGCETLEFSTEVVTKLINLRHLEIHRCKAFEEMMPTGLGKLSSLQSLSSFYVVNDRKKKSGKLNELQNLNSLRGNLEINRLDQVKDVMLETQHVNLKDKKLLESLDLNWENQDNKQNNFRLLENLCPHQNLKRLHVRWYPGYEFSSWLSSINHLSYISLFGFDNCKSLPPLEHLPCLKSLEISSMKVLEYIHLEEVFHTAATFFPSLERLKFSGCKNFTGWQRMKRQVSVDKLSHPPLGRLSQLIINKCPELTDLPTFPNVEELQLCESMVTPLKETLDIASSSSSTPLSKLKSLKIEGKLPEISVLPSRWKQNLTSLEHLEIGDVDNLDIWFEDNFPSLQKVVVYGCDLQALPQKMCDLSSLQHVKMMGCHKLASLPKEMVNLNKLVTLEIWDCPLLVERCQSETGVDWPQVKHVQNIILKENLRQ